MRQQVLANEIVLALNGSAFKNKGVQAHAGCRGGIPARA